MSPITPSNTLPAPDFSLLTPSELLLQLEQEGDCASKELFDACIVHGEVMVQALAAKIDDEATWNRDGYDAWGLP